MKRSLSHGISMVEILVALAVGLFLTAGIIQLFVSSKQAYNAEEGFARLQENGRFALEAIAHDLRMYGNMGCSSMAQLEKDSTLSQTTNDAGDVTHSYWGVFNVLANDLVDDNTVLVGTKRPLGYRQETATAAEKALVDPSSSVTWLANTDALVVSGVFKKGIYLKSDMGAWDSNLVLESTSSDIAAGDLAVVTDCANADIFAVTSATVDSDTGTTTLQHQATRNRSTQFSTVYKTDSPSSINAMVFPFAYKTYFVGTKASDASHTPSLYVSYFGVKDSKPARYVQELVPDVDDMVVTFYGQDDDHNGTPDGYERADAVTNWDQVVSARVELLVRSPADHLVTQVKTVSFDGTDYTDGHLRKEFATTVALRGRPEWRLNP